MNNAKSNPTNLFPYSQHFIDYTYNVPITFIDISCILSERWKMSVVNAQSFTLLMHTYTYLLYVKIIVYQNK